MEGGEKRPTGAPVPAELQDLVSNKVTRRAFLAGAISAPLAATALAESTGLLSLDDLDLDFVLVDGGAELVVSVIQGLSPVEQAAQLKADPEWTFKSAEWRADELLWSIKAKSFGPEARFVLNSREVGPQRYRRYGVRVDGASFGRLKGRRIDFVFEQMPDTSVEPGRQTPKLIFRIGAKTNLWSLSRSATTGDRFTLQTFPPEAPVDNPKNYLRLRAFADKSRPMPLRQLVDAGRISSTFRLVFNGQVTFPDRFAAANVGLALDNDCRWTIDASAHADKEVALTALHPDIRSQKFDMYWSMQSVEQAEKTSDAAGQAAGVTEENGGAATTSEIETPATARTRQQLVLYGEGAILPIAGPITIGDANGPRLELTAATGEKVTSPALSIRTAFDPGEQGLSVAYDKVRSEAALLGDWSDVWIVDGKTRTGPFSSIQGRLLERVDAPKKAGDQSPARAEGNIGFHGYFRPAAHPMRVTTPIGGALFVGDQRERPPSETTQEKVAEMPPDPFARRRGDAVSMVFTWGAGIARNAPVAQWMEVNGAITELDTPLEGSSFSRLTFEPTDAMFLYAKKGLNSQPQYNYIRLSGPEEEEQARIDLSRASLRAARYESLQHLRFEFSNLALSWSMTGIELVRTSTACQEVTRRDANGRLLKDDNRPTLVVEFPGQHVFEEAKFIPKLGDLPDVKLEKAMLTVDRRTGAVMREEAFAEGAARALVQTDTTFVIDANNRSQVSAVIDDLGKVEVRKTFRTALRALKRPTSPGVDPQRDRFGALDSAYERAADQLWKYTKLPLDQLIYIGPFGLDPDALKLAGQVYASRMANQITRTIDDMLGKTASPGIETPDQLGGVTGLAKKLVLAAQARASTAEALLYRDAAISLEAALVLEGVLEAGFPSYQQFRAFYREMMLSLFAGDGLARDYGINLAAPSEMKAAELEALAIVRAEPTAQGGTGIGRPLLLERHAAIVAAFKKSVTSFDPPSGLVQGRLASPSRLAFRVRCRDGIQEARLDVAELDHSEDDHVELPRDRLVFTLTDLTRFHDFELAVTRRAQVVYQPTSSGLIGLGTPRQIDLNPGAMLDHLGFATGANVLPEQRLRDISASLREPPGRLETAIEIPARLVLSPNQNAVVVAPMSVPASIFSKPDAASSPIHLGGGSKKPPSHQADLKHVSMHRLWSADFLTGELDPGLRAVHSPDFADDFVYAVRDRRRSAPLGSDGNALPRPRVGPPARGPLAPWLIDRFPPTPEKASLWAKLTRFRRGQTGQRRLNDLKFRGPTDAYIRHELVLLSSGWGLPVVGRRTEADTLVKNSSQLEPGANYRLRDVAPGAALYEPRTLTVQELSLTALGGTLRHATTFEPPAAAKDLWGEPLFDALSIESWQQWTNLGRDVYCEVVFKGFLYPLGHRASLVMVTERDFFVHPTEGVRAYLRQRMFVRVGKTEKEYPAVRQPYQGRRFPASLVNMLTDVTPDIVDPTDPPASSSTTETGLNANGRVDIAGGTGLVFWPRTARVQEANIRFELDIDDKKTDMPLLFVDNGAANDPVTLKGIGEYYNSLAAPDKSGVGSSAENRISYEPLQHLRTVRLNGHKHAYAPEHKSGTASIETDLWTLIATGKANAGTPQTGPAANAGEAGVGNTWTQFFDFDYDFDPVLQGADQPPFYPAVQIARVRARQTEQLIGRPLEPIRAMIEPHYILNGLTDPKDPEARLPGNQSEVFLAFLDQVSQDMGEKGDQGGGVFRQAGVLAAMSRKRGLLTLGSKAASEDAKLEGTPLDKAFSVAAKFEFAPKPTQVVPQDGSAPSPGPTALPTTTDSRQMDRIREVYSSFFSEEAKILGLVKIRDLFKLIRETDLSNPDTGLPQLDEVIQYGAGQLQEGAEQAQGAVGDAVAGVATGIEAVRTEVIQPLSKVVTDIRQQWDALERQILDAQQKLPALQTLGAGVRMSSVFPELDTGLRELASALVASAAEPDPALFALTLSEVYEAGRRFLDALKRTGSNPTKHLSDALRAGFGEAFRYIELLKGDAKKVLPSVANALIDDYLAKADTSSLFGLLGTSAAGAKEALFKALRIAGKDNPTPGEIQSVAVMLSHVIVPLQAAGDDATTAWGVEIFRLRAPPPGGEVTGDQWTSVVLALRLRRADARKFAQAILFRVMVDIQNQNSVQGAFTRLMTQTWPFGKPVARAILESQRSRIAAVEEMIKTWANQAKDAVTTQLAFFKSQIEVRLQTLKDDILDQAVELLAWLETELGDEWRLVSGAYDIVRDFIAAVQAGDPKAAAEAGITFVELFAGPVRTWDPGFCADIDRLWVPIRHSLGAVNVGDLSIAPNLKVKAFCPPEAATQPVRAIVQNYLVEPIESAFANAVIGIASSCEAAEVRLTGTLPPVGLNLKITGLQQIADSVDRQTLEPKPPALLPVVRQFTAPIIPGLEALSTQAKAIALISRRTLCDLINDSHALAELEKAIDEALKTENVCTGADEVVEALRNAHVTFSSAVDLRRRLLNNLLNHLQRLGVELRTLTENENVQGLLVLAGLGAVTAWWTTHGGVAQLTALKQQFDSTQNDITTAIAAVKAEIDKVATHVAGYAAIVLGDIVTVIDRTDKAVADLSPLASQIGRYVSIQGLEEQLAKLRAARDAVRSFAAALQVIAAAPSDGDFDSLRKLAQSGQNFFDFLALDAPISIKVTAEAQDAFVAEVRKLRSMGDAFLRAARTDVLQTFDGVVAQALNKDLPFRIDGRAKISTIYNLIVEKRNGIHADLVAKQLTALADRTLQVNPARRLALPPSGEVYKPNADEGPFRLDGDRLSGDDKWLAALTTGEPKAISDPHARRFTVVFLREWGDLKPSPLVILDQVGDLVSELLRGEFFKAIDFNRVRDSVEQYLLSLIPTKREFTYKFAVPLGAEVGKATMGIFAPAAGTKLEIDSKIVVDINPKQPSLSGRAVGKLGPFDIKLIGDLYDALTLRFGGARFTSEIGAKTTFDIEYRDYVIGEELQFLEDLQSIMTPKASGAFIRPTFSPIGVEAGYSLTLSDFSIGAMAFSNVALNTSAVLPFDAQDARFRASLSSRLSPFTITYLPYGGSGFFAIEANTDGIVGFEASFEFGGSAVFAFGPLSGKGRLMSGFYIRQQRLSSGRKVTELSGTFYVGGSASIWIFSFGASLHVRLGMVDGNMSGEAVFTYSFSIGIKDFEFSVTVWKQEGKGFKGQQAALGNPQTRFAQTGDKFGTTQDNGLLKSADPRVPHIRNDTVCQGQNWSRYGQYFFDNTPPADFFT